LCTCAGDEFWTDANSMEMVRRVRGARPAFAAKPLDDKHTANPLGGNYFPITSAMYLREPGGGAQLSLVTDRGQGASCCPLMLLWCLWCLWCLSFPSHPQWATPAARRSCPSSLQAPPPATCRLSPAN